MINLAVEGELAEKRESLILGLAGGVAPAMATPLKAGGEEVDLARLEVLVDFLIQRGVRGLFVGGTTGEGVLLKSAQRELLHRRTVELVSGRVPVLVHVGTANTASSVRLAQHAASCGADAIVAVTPYFYPIHDGALLDHFQTIARAAPAVPFLAYDIPHMAVNTVSPSLVGDLATQLPSFAGLKCSQRDAQAVRRLIDALPENTMLLAGNESVALGLLGLGATGLISGVSTALPEPFVALAGAFVLGDLLAARRHQKTINRILDLMPPGARIGAIKLILKHRGIDVGPPVPPRPSPADTWGPEPILELLADWQRGTPSD